MNDNCDGQLAWEAYAAAVGGTTYDDKPLPTWYELGARQQDGWTDAAKAVENVVKLRIIKEISDHD